MVESFYVVWNPKGGNPRARHDTYMEARAEAERLAHRNPDTEFFVLLSLASAKTTTRVQSMTQSVQYYQERYT